MGNAKFPVTGLSDRACLPTVLNHANLCFCCTYCHFGARIIRQTTARSGKAPGSGCRGEGMGLLAPGRGGSDPPLSHQVCKSDVTCINAGHSFVSTAQHRTKGSQRDATDV